MDVRVGLWRKLSSEELMLLNCVVGEDSWESLGLQRDPTSPSERKSVLNIHWKDWCWSWNSSILVIWCQQPTHWFFFFYYCFWACKKKIINSYDMKPFLRRTLTITRETKDTSFCSILLQPGLNTLQKCISGPTPAINRYLLLHHRKPNSINKIWDFQLIGIVPDAGKDWGQREKWSSEDEMAGWHH